MERYVKRMRTEWLSASFWRDVLGEGVATLILVSIQCALPLTWGTSSLGGVVQIALGMGFVVSALIEVFGEMGGAHMNPAVSVSMALAGKITLLRAIFYIILQCCGALGGAALVYGLTPSDNRENLAATTVNPSLSSAEGAAVEAWLTFILVLVIWGATNSQRRMVHMPSVPIGMVVALDIMAGIQYTGASMNPARSLGPAVLMDIWDDHWVYWVGPIGGGILATIVYTIVLNRPDRRELKQTNHMERKDMDYQKLMKAVEQICGNTNMSTNSMETTMSTDTVHHKL